MASATSESATPVAAAAALATPATAASSTEGQLSFWQQSLEAHKHSLLQCMLLHDNEAEAEDMNAGEVAEIFEMCNIQKEWTVCEWAAGMGRITPLLAQQCRFVYASDFVSEFCAENARRCAALGVANVQVDCIDAASFAPAASAPPPHTAAMFDLSFVNWLLLYLDDEHAEKFLRAAKDSLKTQITSSSSSSSSSGSGSSGDIASGSGLIFLHESCWERPNESALFSALEASEQSRLLALPNDKTEDCQTYYRKVYWYENLFRKIGLEVLKAKELSVYKQATFGEEDTAAASTTDAAATKEDAAAAAATEEETDEDSYYNRQMCWLLRIKQ